MEHSHFFEQDHGYSTTLALADFGAQFYKQRFNITPLDVCASRAGEDQFKSSLVLALQAGIVPLSGTELGERTSKRLRSKSRRQALARCRSWTSSQISLHFHAKRSIDPRLIANPLRLEELQNVRIQTNRGENFRGCSLRPAAPLQYWTITTTSDLRRPKQTTVACQVERRVGGDLTRCPKV